MIQMLNYYICQTAKLICLDYATHYETKILTKKYTLKITISKRLTCIFISLWISKQRLINARDTKIKTEKVQTQTQNQSTINNTD